MQSTEQDYHVPAFPSFPAVTRYVALGSVEEAFARVCRSVDAQEAVSLVIGPPGTGKSLICGLLVEQYKETHEVVVLGETPIEDRASFLRHLLHHLGMNFSQTPENDLQLALVDRVCGPSSASGGLLIVIDEAQSIAPEVLEAVRMVTNIMKGGVPRVSAVVCGAMKLDEVLIDTSLEAFTQRIATRCYLHPMNAHETRYYIHEIIRGCGADPKDVIVDEAASAIHHASSGVPRLVNQMMTQAIDTAEEAGESLITEAVVDRAWAALQQLPCPMVDEPSLQSTGGAAVEFGELELAPMKPLEKKSMQSAAMDDDQSDCEVAEQEESESLGFADEDEWQLADESIDLERSTAMWVDDSDEEYKAVAPLPSALFGEFEIEEEISPSVSKNASPSIQQSIPARESAPAAAKAPARMSLESMLHQEIVGMTSVDPTVEVYSDSSDVHQNLMDVGSNCDSQNRCDDDCSNECDGIGDSEMNAADEDMDANEYESDDYENEDQWSDRLRLANDDSDILVIEDELELTRTDSPESSESAPRSVTIDFQSMLSRMRTGT
ncbi:MAG: AAA family ATPase [Rubripirellula sp.]